LPQFRIEESDIRQIKNEYSHCNAALNPKLETSAQDIDESSSGDLSEFGMSLSDVSISSIQSGVSKKGWN
jgi:hypothetical protein